MTALRGQQDLGSRQAVILLGLVILSNAALNTRGFFQGHFGGGDQKSYISIAMKLDTHGLRDYNLRGIRVEYDGRFVELSNSPSNQPGDVVEAFQSEGAPFYDQPLFHAPPLFPFLLTLSHRVFASGQTYKAVPLINIEGSARAAEIWRVQFYSVVVSVVSNLLLLLATYLLGEVLFSRSTGVLAAFLVSVTPADVLAANLIWADTTLSALVTLAALLLYRAMSEGSWQRAVGGGLAFGAALLTKNSALILVIPIAICAWLGKSYKESRDQVSRPEHRKSLPAWTYLGIFLIISFLIALPWYAKVTAVFGTPLYNPSYPGISRINPWFEFINDRPWYTLAAGLPYQMPLYLGGYIGIGLVLLRKRRDRRHVFLTAWFLSFILVVTIAAVTDEMLGPDSRYMLPAYPPLAVLSAHYFLRLKVYLQQRCSWLPVHAVTALLLSASTIWALFIAYRGLKMGEIVAPF